MSVTLPARLLDKFEADDCGCWVWTSRKDRGGYGKVKLDGRTRTAHAVFYECLVGPVPSGLELDHLCRNRGCVNPAHLEPVSRKENVLRGASPAAANARKTHCPRGHAFTPENTEVRTVGQSSRNCRTCKRAKDMERYWKKRGVVAERFMAPDSRSGDAQASEGSNPSHTVSIRFATVGASW